MMPTVSRIDQRCRCTLLLIIIICKLIITADMVASKGWPLPIMMLYVYYDGREEGGCLSCCGSCWTEASFFFLVCCCVEAFLNILQA